MNIKGKLVGRGKSMGKKGRQGIITKVEQKTFGVVSYQDVEKIVENSDEWKKLHQKERFS